MRTTEQKIIDEMSKNSFKARPLNKKILEKREDQSDAKVKIAPTKIEEFKLSISKLKKCVGYVDEDECSTQFKALPLNKKLMQPKIVGRNSAPARITKQRSFNLSTEQRAKLPRKQIEIKEEFEVKKFKAR